MAPTGCYYNYYYYYNYCYYYYHCYFYYCYNPSVAPKQLLRDHGAMPGEPSMRQCRGSSR